MIMQDTASADVGHVPVVAHGVENSIIEFDGPRDEQSRVFRLGRHGA